MDEVVVVETKPKKVMLSIESSSEDVNGDGTESDVLFAGSQELNCQVDLGSNITQCCVPNCSTSSINNINSSHISFVTFPKDPSRFTEWIRAIGRSDLLSYLGKKEATNLLICSKHFPQNMWVNSNTRLKRLHKSAVPEKSYNDDIDIIAVTSVSDKSLSTRKSGIKVKKVTSLLTDSALRAALASPLKDTSPALNMSNNSPSVVHSQLDFKGRKLPLILPRPKSIVVSTNTPDIIKRPKPIPRTPKVIKGNNAESEKKLSIENRNLKDELDKNMDFILSQKAHYEGLIAKEKETIKDLQSKVASLETSQRKMYQTYENQSRKQASDAERMSKIKNLTQINESYEKRLEIEMQTIHNLQTMNNELQSHMEELLQERESTPITHSHVNSRPNFIGENFKDFLYLHLDKEKNLEEKVTDLLLELDKTNTSKGKKEEILNLASSFLNHLHLSWLKWVLKVEGKEIDFDERLWEFALSIYDVSKEAYVKCVKAFGLPSPEEVKKYAKDQASPKGTTNSLINALYDEAQALPTKELLNKNTLDSDNGYDDALEFEGKCRKRSIWKEKFNSKKFKNDDDEEEGKVSDEDEEVVFTDSEEEEEEETEEEVENEEVAAAQVVAKEEVVDSKDLLLPSKLELPVASTSSQDFDFMVGGEEELEEEEEEDEAMEITRAETTLKTENDQPLKDPQVHNMPLLGIDSPMTISQRDIINGNSTSDLKISNRKKIISSDASLPSGSKVVFRVIES